MKVTPLALALLLSKTQTVSQLFSLGPHNLRTQLSDFILHGVQTKVLGIEDSFSFFALLSCFPAILSAESWLRLELMALS